MFSTSTSNVDTTAPVIESTTYLPTKQPALLVPDRTSVAVNTSDLCSHPGGCARFADTYHTGGIRGPTSIGGANPKRTYGCRSNCCGGGVCNGNNGSNVNNTAAGGGGHYWMQQNERPRSVIASGPDADVFANSMSLGGYNANSSGSGNGGANSNCGSDKHPMGVRAWSVCSDCNFIGGNVNSAGGCNAGNCGNNNSGGGGGGGSGGCGGGGGGSSSPQTQRLATFSKHRTIQLREKHIGPSIQTFFRANPLKIVQGDRQYMYDENGRQYLDCINNVAHVGHSHPDVNQAITNQLRLLNTNIRFLHDNVVELAKRLVDTFPPALTICFFVNSGSEANDLALRLAKYYTKNNDILTLENAYHGHTCALTAISPYKFAAPGGGEEAPKEGVHVMPVPSTYRLSAMLPTSKDTVNGTANVNVDVAAVKDMCLDTPEGIGEACAAVVGAACDRLAKEGRPPALFIAESMQSCGGQVVYPQGYLKRCQEHLHRVGGVIVIDEVQTGFGRIGEHMWAFQKNSDDFVPDIVTIGKPMGNGYPVAGVVTTQVIANAFARGPEYFNTYGGTPVACAAALAVLNVIETEQLMQKAREVGGVLMAKLLHLKHRHPSIGDIRGCGLFIGIDLVKDKATKEPDRTLANEVRWMLRTEGILVSCDGPYENVLKLKPPMCFNKFDAERTCEAIDKALTLISSNGYRMRFN